jgi:hypothetical protein
MDHFHIEEHEVAERYLLGRLAAEEAEAFEEHYLGCPECLDHLEAVEGLRQGLRQEAARQVAAAAIQLGLLGRLARLSRSRTGALLATAALLIALVPSGLLLRRVGQLDRELGRSRAESAERQGARNTARSLETRIAESEQTRKSLEAERSTARQALEEERRQRQELTRELETLRQPQVNTPVVPLGMERSGPGASGEPTVRLQLPSSPGWVVLSLEMSDPLYPRYRAALLGPDGRRLWEGTDLRPDAQGTLTLLLPTSLLAPGDSAVRVEGIPDRGRAVAIGDFTFRAVRGR